MLLEVTSNFQIISNTEMAEKITENVVEETVYPMDLFSSLSTSPESTKQDSVKKVDIVNKVDIVKKVDSVKKVYIVKKKQKKDMLPEVRSCNAALTNVQCSDRQHHRQAGLCQGGHRQQGGHRREEPEQGQGS